MRACPRCGTAIEEEFKSSPIPVHCPTCGLQFSLDGEGTLGEGTIDFRPVEERGERWPPRFPDPDRYEIQDRIAAGRLSDVYRARDKRLERLVAIKIFRQSDYRLTQGALAAAQLQHPGILRLLDAGFANGMAYLVSDFIDGQSLQHWIAADQRFSPRDAAELCVQIARAVQHLHDHGVIHRDLKPFNILIQPTGMPCIVDFDLAVLARHPEADSEGMVVGTPAYMSPEQARGARIDQRADIYSIGVILFQLLAGRRPFQGSTMRDVLDDAIHRPPPAPRQINPVVSIRLESICLKCLEKDPSQRFASAAELASALEEVVRNDAAENGSDSTIARLRRWIDRRFGGAAPAETPIWAEPALTESQRKVEELNRALVTTQAEHQLYRSLVEGLPLCVFRTDLAGKFEFANDFLGKTLGVPPESIRGKSPRDVFPAAVAARHEADNERVIATGKVVEGTEEHPATDGGSPTSFEVIKLPVRSFGGEIVGVQGIMHDVSAHAQAERVLRDAKRVAEEANAAKNVFLANMSHEIRTPMNAIIGLTDLLIKQQPPGEQQELLTLILRSGRSLLVIIDELLDFSKIEAGRLELHREPFDLRELLQQVHATFAIPTGKDVNVSLELGPGVPTWVSGDCVRLRQVLMNLLGNASKFTERGKVVFRASRVLESAPQASVAEERMALRFAISDTGVGIPADKQAAIFAPFVQADGSISRRYGGTGLGLAISAQLVRLMGGEIHVRSSLGQGSEFHFTIELPVSQAPTPPAGAAAIGETALGRPRPLRILVAEDHPINQEFAARALGADGHTVVLVSNGQEAILAAREPHFDLVLMDVQMPLLDGLQATAKIREHERTTGRRVPIVAMTAHALAGDRERCLAAGMDGYLTKPILVDDLYAAIAGILAVANSLAAPRAVSQRRESAAAVFDPAKLQERARNDQVLLRRIVAMFDEDYPELKRKIDAALAAQDSFALCQVAHTLKGVVRNFHAERAGDNSEALERSGRLNDWADAQLAWNRLQSDIAELQTALREWIARPA